MPTGHHIEKGGPVDLVEGDDIILPHLIKLFSDNEALIERARDHLMILTIPRIIGFATSLGLLGSGKESLSFSMRALKISSMSSTNEYFFSIGSFKALKSSGRLPVLLFSAFFYGRGVDLV